MKIKYILFSFALILFLGNARTVSAAEGSIRIEVPKKLEKVTVCYSKDGEEEKQRIFENGEDVILKNLSAGSYKIRLMDTENYNFTDSEIPVPMWNEQKRQMEYEIEISPKYRMIETSPQTGDSAKGIKFIVIGCISLLIVALMSCHNRFNCGRMSHKYSEKRRT